ncbi:hypothetical protein RB601_002959 [Gaeumannomyces tritici]
MAHSPASEAGNLVTMAPSLPHSYMVGDFDCNIGVEFEFVVQGLRGGRPPSLDLEAPDSEQDKRVQEVRHVLRKANIRCYPPISRDSPAYFDNDDWDRGSGLLSGFLDESARKQGFEIQVPGPQRKYQFWMPHPDLSVIPDRFQTMAGPADDTKPSQGCEISSRVMRASDAAGEVTRVLGALRSDMKVCNTTTAGLHLHMSEPPSGDSPGGTVRTLTTRRLISLLVMIEGSMYKLCDPERLMSAHCKPVTESVRAIAVRGDPAKPLSKLGRQHISAALKNVDKQTMAYIWDESITHVDIPYFVSAPALRVKPIGNSDPELASNAFDFEFRYLEGTLDPILTCQWARVCCALFRIAATYSTDMFRLKMLELDRIITPDHPAWHRESRIPLKTSSLRDFLAALGIDNPATYIFWLEKLIANEQAMIARPIVDGFLAPLSEQ